MPTIDKPLDELQGYTGSSPVPADFDQFWERGLAELGELEARGFNEEWREASFRVPGVRCFDLYFDGVGGARLHAKTIFPQQRGAHGETPAPALFKFHGYTMHAGDWSTLLAYAAAGMAVFALDVRGQGGESSDPGGVPGNTQRGHIVRGIEGAPEELFYRQAFLDTAGLVRLGAALDGVDETRMGSLGESQGGALSLACAALDDRIGAVWAVYPFLSDYRRAWELEAGNSAYEEIRHWLKRKDPRHQRIEEFFERLGYIDVQNLAGRITGSVTMITCLMDEICPPSTQFAVYNKLNSEKRMILYPDYGHDRLPDQADMALTWFMRRFGIDPERG